MMEIEKKNTTSKRTKWIHSQLSFKQINIISLSINNLTHKNTYKIKIIFKFNNLKKAIKLHAVTANPCRVYDRSQYEYERAESRSGKVAIRVRLTITAIFQTKYVLKLGNTFLHLYQIY
jgi:hypothetical protein